MTTAATTKDDASDPAFLGTRAQSRGDTIPSLTGGEDSKSGLGTNPILSQQGEQHQHQQHEQQENRTQTLTWRPTSTATSAIENGPSLSTEANKDHSQSSIQVTLTHDVLSLDTASKFVSSPSAGANVFFTGTTRSTFAGRTVTRLEYTAYMALALRTMLQICRDVHAKHALERVYLVHRLGVVRVSEMSIVIGVSSAHRKSAWQAGEELLELVKDRVEVWKREWFLDGTIVTAKDGEAGTNVLLPDDRNDPADAHVTERGEWRANADNDASGNRISQVNQIHRLTD